LVCHEYHRQYGGCGGNRRGVVLWVLERSGEAAVVPFYEKLSLCCGAQSVFSILRASGGEKQISGVCSLAEGADTG